MTIPALPDAPALGDSPEVFNTKAFAFVAALDDWGTAANAVAAAVDADATAADADAATATTQAGIATTKANEAAASAVDANSAELGAQAAQTAAELAATNAAASYDAFDDRYLGAKSSDPTVDNDGGALIIGALYFNTTDQKMKVYATLGWKDAGSAVNGTARRQSFTATAGQTSFTVTDGYDANFADVYLNGVKLVNGTDVTVTSGTAVVLTSGAAAGDSVDVVAYGAFEVANVYTQAQADAEFLRKAGEDGLTVSGGNFGFGTSSPSAKLSISDAAAPKLNLLVGSIERAFISYTESTALMRLDTDGDIVFAPNNTEYGRFNANGSLLVGTSTNSVGSLSMAQVLDARTRNTGFGLGIIGNSSNTQVVRFAYDTSAVGSINITSSTTSYGTSSDYRLKENIAPMAGALAKVAALKPCTYTWKVDGSDGQGFIAHELQAVVPDCVTGEKDATRIEQYEISPAVPATYDEEGNELTPAVEAAMGEREVPSYQGIDTSFLVATLTAAIQEQQAQIEQLKADVAALKGQA